MKKQNTKKQMVVRVPSDCTDTIDTLAAIGAKAVGSSEPLPRTAIHHAALREGLSVLQKRIGMEVDL